MGEIEFYYVSGDGPARPIPNVTYLLGGKHDPNLGNESDDLTHDEPAWQPADDCPI